MGSIGLVAVLVFLAVPVGYLTLQARALKRWHGRWYEAARWSAWAMGGLAAWAALGVALGNGLNVLPLALGLPVAAGYQFGLHVAYWVVYEAEG